MASTPEDAQKRPRRCRKCQMPMKGHKAETCIAAQEISSLATPPASPANAATNIRNRTRNTIEIAVERHWRDPSWIPQAAKVVPPVPTHSGVPTVLVDEDGNTILGSHNPGADVSDAESDDPLDAPGPMLRPKSPMAQVMDQAHALRLCDPVLSIVKVSMADLPRMQATAGQSGLCTSIVRTPWAAPRFKDEFEPTLNWADERNVWVVVGDDPTLVQRTADLQAQYEKVPGAIKDDVVVVQATYKHIIIASTVSALVVLGVVGLFV
ncbi:hypothetical protein DFH08DRAFT_35363 [Mycena albidolilacea]|uniref:Uncharacterized protein n=1 Tax=Mycena albidolilacea TaxID=1033008 RepID=A0AAD7F7N2_9AGAR|nr:hypothetical protein DFH08DRAFT_35363 [Mycena albidolilacea]